MRASIVDEPAPVARANGLDSRCYERGLAVERIELAFVAAFGNMQWQLEWRDTSNEAALQRSFDVDPRTSSPE